MKLSTEAAVFKRKSLLIGGPSNAIGGPGPPGLPLAPALVLFEVGSWVWQGLLGRKLCPGFPAAVKAYHCFQTYDLFNFCRFGQVPVMLLLQGGQLFLSIQEVGGYLVPSIAAIFMLGVFWTRCNEMVRM